MQYSYFDALETRSTDERTHDQLTALPKHIALAQQQNPFYSRILAGINAHEIDSFDAFSKLPILRKSEIAEYQRNSRTQNDDPFAGIASSNWRKHCKHIFASPGGIYEPEAKSQDYWRIARALYAAGFRQGDLIHNAFSYHMMPGGFMMESAALALGCIVFPAGTGNTEQQLQIIFDLNPNGFIGTPSFLRILLEKAAEIALPLSIPRALFSGEALPPSLREWFSLREIDVYQCFAVADLGLIAYESQAREGMIIDEKIYVELVQPGTNQPVADGEIGELIVTSFSEIYPLIRFATGDLTAVLPGICPTGRTNKRIKGWMGRADQTYKMRGIFVYPKQVHLITENFPEIKRARLVVSGNMANDEIELMVEVESRPDGLTEKIAQLAKEIIKLRVEVSLHAVGTLPNDSVVIEDKRDYK